MLANVLLQHQLQLAYIALTSAKASKHTHVLSDAATFPSLNSYHRKLTVLKKHLSKY